MFEERRKYKRFKGKKGAFAAFIRPKELINTGQILDISMGGLCVRYVSTDEDNEGCSGIKIFGSNDSFIHLDKVHCRIVYDRKVPKRSCEQMSTRRCGVEFENLSVEQLSILQAFIDHFAFDKTRKSKGQVTPREFKTRKASRVEIDSKRTTLPSNRPDA